MIWKGDERMQSFSILGAAKPVQEGLQQKHRGYENKESGICVLSHTAMHYGKSAKEKAQPWLEAAVDFCNQAMQEPCYWFGLSWTLGQTHIQTLPTESSRRILEAWNGTFHSSLICSLGIFTAKHCILLQIQNSRSYLWQN